MITGTEITGEEPAMPHPNHQGRSGLSIRQYFAAMAMQGFCAMPNADTYTNISIGAVKMADALIAELNKTSDK